MGFKRLISTLVEYKEDYSPWSDFQTEVVVPSNIKKIAPNCFENCRHIKKVTLPNSIQSIGSNAFKDCINIETINLGNTNMSLNTKPCK